MLSQTVLDHIISFLLFEINFRITHTFKSMAHKWYFPTYDPSKDDSEEWYGYASGNLWTGWRRRKFQLLETFYTRTSISQTATILHLCRNLQLIKRHFKSKGIAKLTALRILKKHAYKFGFSSEIEVKTRNNLNTRNFFQVAWMWNEGWNSEPWYSHRDVKCVLLVEQAPYLSVTLTCGTSLPKACFMSFL